MKKLEVENLMTHSLYLGKTVKWCALRTPNSATFHIITGYRYRISLFHVQGSYCIMHITHVKILTK